MPLRYLPRRRLLRAWALAVVVGLVGAVAASVGSAQRRGEYSRRGPQTGRQADRRRPTLVLRTLIDRLQLSVTNDRPAAEQSWLQTTSVKRCVQTFIERSLGPNEEVRRLGIELVVSEDAGVGLTDVMPEIGEERMRAALVLCLARAIRANPPVAGTWWVRADWVPFYPPLELQRTTP